MLYARQRQELLITFTLFYKQHLQALKCLFQRYQITTDNVTTYFCSFFLSKYILKNSLNFIGKPFKSITLHMMSK